MDQIHTANHRYANSLQMWLSFPFIYGMIIPLALLDLGIEIYHHVCFRLYGIPLVDRRRYITIDRHRLSYLDFWSKVSCVYCGYANGLLHYASVITAATELYWCPIQHEKGEDFSAPRHHQRFAKYGDIQDLKRVLALDRTDPEFIGEPTVEAQSRRRSHSLTQP